MPRRRKSGKPVSNSGKSKGKKSATSPLEKETGHLGVPGSKTGSGSVKTLVSKNSLSTTTVGHDNSNQNKRFRTSAIPVSQDDLSGSYLQTPQNQPTFYPIPNMSYQQPSYPAGFMQALQFSPPFGATPPQWAVEIIEDIKTIKASVAKIDKNRENSRQNKL